ncbi:hypothetical protein [Chitinophaga sp. Cy-1792]|uniref:hypothetical protein n=1 Tax=Chitinophaga sp. Cy-1792 TaxID=2608339 RepID=UPI0014236780|nr:hypothetical protein [Chitinophaga sp. Cy-1792]NIG56493.1 hypothetical protein [Chitinophaga sp. Cy-1792]
MTTKKFIPILFLCLLISLCGCHSQQIPLSAEENKYAEILAKAFEAEAFLQHDFRAAKENRKDGRFLIMIRNSKHPDFCKADSSIIKKVSSVIAHQLYNKMENKSNYHQIECVFIKYETISSTIQQEICDRRATVLTKNLDTAMITMW